MSPEGILIMTRWIKLYMMDYDEVFPSPTGVTYYELSYGLGMVSTILSGKLFPSPTGVNYYEYWNDIAPYDNYVQ